MCYPASFAYRVRIRPMPAELSTIPAAVTRVRERIARAAVRAGRRPEEIRLVAVTKTLGPEVVRAAYEAGVRHFGENRVQEWDSKRSEVGHLDKATFHMIGHLQRNKARHAAAIFDRIDSIDSLALARKLEQAAAEERRRIPVLIEVRLSQEPAKSGIEPESLDALAIALMALSHLDLEGLMTVPPWSEDPEPTRPYFRTLRDLRDRLAARIGRHLPVLSMGMTNDFEVAIEEGATEVRIGTAIFGRRHKHTPEKI
jgi:pyridoxal phosphate enzyme (YggS family)